jgi:hypothetical protein
MKILLISYGKWEFDGRLRELVNITKKLGECKYITRINNLSDMQDKFHIGISRGNYLHFMAKSIREAFSFKKIDILFIDNRKAIIPGLIIKYIKKPQNIILDVRELYISKEINYFTGKIGCYVERLMIKRANIVICANKYRSDFMKNYYNLEMYPLVFENIRQLKSDNLISKMQLLDKYNYILSKSTIKIISTSGYSIDRTNDKLVEAMSVLGDRFELFLVGGGSIEDKRIIDNIINKKNIKNVNFIDMVEINELRYLISKCDIGVVNYHQNDLNNKFCASGKIYEFLYEGLPIITTENIPLLFMCNTYNIGVSDNNYIEGIKKIYKEYDYYKKNVENYICNIDVDKNNFELFIKIKDLLRM